ncbi:hypothetical protein ZWY2020_001206 [Hordeum vulgare]|nr:hypothetical protein ZWY2020_001206 [Hordeum vulgare]
MCRYSMQAHPYFFFIECAGGDIEHSEVSLAMEVTTHPIGPFQFPGAFNHTMELTTNVIGPSQFSGSSNQNASFQNIAPSLSMSMSFGDCSAFYAPPIIPREFTSLLLQGDEHNPTMSTVRRLDFDEGTSANRFQW